MFVPMVPSRQSSMVDSGRRRDEDDDEELAEIWAALERLPTYDRLRRTVLESGTASRRVTSQVDTKDVDVARYIREQIFKLNTPTEDHANFLSRFRDRIDRAGVKIPTVEVRYENVTIDGKVHVGTRALPTLWNTVLNNFEAILSALRLSPSQRRDVKILDGVSGVLKPGRMTLLLGPPGAGKTTLLLALAGMLDPNLKVQGKVSFNGHTFDEFQPRKSAAYISQDDLHLSVLTVRETMDFSARYQGVGIRYNFIAELLKREEEQGIRPDSDLDYFLKGVALEETSHALVTEYVMKLLGLDICADTIVGDQMIRGISGGQRKRLTSGEMMVGPSRALFMDEISTGLDSSTTYSVVKSIGKTAQILKTTILVALLQPPPETYNLFDDVLLLSGGLLVYHGPREDIVEFLASCGFKCPPRKSIADFLQEVTSQKDQEQYWADKSRPYQFVTVREFANAFKNSPWGRKIQEELAVPYEKSEGKDGALVYDKWLLPKWDLFKITFQKECLLLKRYRALYLSNAIQLTIAGCLLGSLFFRTRMHHRNVADSTRYTAPIFFVLNQVVFVGFGEMAHTANLMPMFQKFRSMQFYPPWTWALSMFILKIPFSLFESLALLTGTYYVIGFAPQAGRFFRLWLLLALADQMASGIFRMLAGICRTFVLASSVGGFAIVVLFSLGGYIIPRKDIKKWWIWGYWATPLSYAQNGVMVNEFLAPRWRRALPNDDHTLGPHTIWRSDQFARGFWYWLACGVMILFAIGTYLAFAWFITFLPPPEKTRTVVPEQLLVDLHADRTGDDQDASLKAISLPRSRSSQLSLTRELGSSRSTGGDTQMAKGSIAGSASGRTPSTRSRSASMTPKRGMVLPFQPLAISFSNVNYFVRMPTGTTQEGSKDNRLQLLHDITGAFRPGVLTALVGVTGAGKSTLMDVLAGRKTKGWIEGDIRISGFPKKHETFARISGYCEQNDVHSPQITVHESLIFSTWLRLPREIEPDKKMEFVQEVMDLVELTPLKDGLVGRPGESGLSTEQRKRLTIAVELVANPSIIFMDEPTSGLDARAAATVMRAVRNTVDTGRTVVCTIHQPSLDIFESFDELLLLKRGGEMIYAGPLGRRSHHLVEYFERIEGVPKIKEEENPAAWMLEVSTPGMEDKLGINFAKIYRESSVFQQNKALVEQLSCPIPNSQALAFDTRFAQPVWVQFTCNLWKQHWTYWRSPAFNLMRFFLSLASALFFGTVFWDMGKKLGTQRNLYSLMGAIFASQAFYGVLTASAIQPVVNSERTVFYRERSAGMYSEVPFALAQCVIEIPYTIISSGMFSIISFAMIQLQWDAGKFFWYMYFVWCSQLTFSFWGMTTVGLTPNPGQAAFLAGFVYNFWTLFNGFLLPHPKFPVWWRWIYWLDPQSYTLYGTLVSQFGDLDDTYTTTTVGDRLTVKQLLRRTYGYRHSFLGFVAIMTFMWPLIMAIAYIMAIRFINYQQR